GGHAFRECVGEKSESLCVCGVWCVCVWALCGVCVCMGSVGCVCVCVCVCGLCVCVDYEGVGETELLWKRTDVSLSSALWEKQRSSMRRQVGRASRLKGKRDTTSSGAFPFPRESWP